MTEQQYRPGTIRYVNGDGEEQIASPGSIWYSILTFAAQEVWDVKQQKFVKISEDEDD